MSFIKSTLRTLFNPRANIEALSSIEAESRPAMPRFALSPRDFIYNLPLVFGGLIILAMILVILLGPVWAPHDPNITVFSILPHFDKELDTFIQPPLGPSAEFPLGTDAWGNDMLSLILFGARLTLITGLYITLARIAVGTFFGLLAGWTANSWLDRGIMSLIGAVASLPTLISSMILIYALNIERGPVVFLVALTLVGWTETAQYIRGELLVIRKMPYIEGAESMGNTETQIVVRHALPNLLPQLVILFFLETGAVLILMAELGFLGVFMGGATDFTLDPAFGRPVAIPEKSEWGALVAQGVPSLRSHSHLVLGPAVAFFISVVGLNSFGEGLRRLLQKSAVSTSFLLKKQMLLVVLVFGLISAFVIRATGPSFSYNRVVSSFDGAAAYEHVEALSSLEGEDVGQQTAAYIVEAFKEYGLRRGSKPTGGILQSYYVSAEPELEETPSVVAFLDGYDFARADQLLVLMTSYSAVTDTNDVSPNEAYSGIAVLLELARLWQEQRVGPRRSVLFLAWGGEGGMGEANAYLQDPQHFDFLPIPTKTVAHPVMTLQVDRLGGGGNAMWLAPGSDPGLTELLQGAAAAADVTLREHAPVEPVSLVTAVPAAYLEWSHSQQAAVDADALQQAGQVVGRVMLELVRETQGVPATEG